MEAQESIQRMKFARKKWDIERKEESRKECNKMPHKAKREVAKAKQKAYDELQERLDKKEGEKNLCCRMGRTCSRLR